MKKLRSDSSRKRRNIIAVALVGVLAIIGGVIAYNQDSTFFANLFRLGSVGPEQFIETFDSPSNWGCQVETPKAVSYKNQTGSVRVVRAKYEEYWKEAGSTSTTHDTELPLVRNNERTTIITFENEDDWIKNDEDGWYYYYYKVPNGERTSNFLGSVIYNCDLSEPEGYSCEQTATGMKCESTKNDYAGATYHVYVTIQTEEYDNNDWNTPAYDKRETLYDVIAAQTNGLDTNVNFNLYATKSFGNGNGVNTLSSHAGDKYPVYYFRGEVDNNNVVYENHCWKIVRTAESGAIKMIYAGNYDTENKTCANNTQDDYYINNGTGVAWNVGPGTSAAGADMRATPATVGYMYGNDIYAQQNYSIGSGGYAGTGVTWDGTKYTLINPKLPSELTLQDIEGDYRYYCYWTDVVSDGNNRSCTKARYFSHAITNGSGPFGYGLVLTGA